jgi:hypothetical protein
MLTRKTLVLDQLRCMVVGGGFGGYRTGQPGSAPQGAP